jgi:hypothetical protein
MPSRRTFLKGLTATAAGLLVPGGLADAEEVRRFWALGAMPERRRWEFVVHLNGRDYRVTEPVSGHALTVFVNKAVIGDPRPEDFESWLDAHDFYEFSPPTVLRHNGE